MNAKRETMTRQRNIAKEYAYRLFTREYMTGDRYIIVAVDVLSETVVDAGATSADPFFSSSDKETAILLESSASQRERTTGGNRVFFMIARPR